jgi:hypothetical protein
MIYQKKIRIISKEFLEILEEFDLTKLSLNQQNSLLDKICLHVSLAPFPLKAYLCLLFLKKDHSKNCRLYWNKSLAHSYSLSFIIFQPIYRYLFCLVAIAVGEQIGIDRENL